MSVKIELTKPSVENSGSVPMQDLNENIKEDNPVEENPTSFLPKETKTKYGLAFYNKSSCYTRNMKVTHSKRKFVSSLTDTSAKVVLSERNVEIKDLESKVKFLKNKIKELENENKMLRNLQSRQERELKKCKEGITDIPALLKSQKEEIKAYESTISSIRQELRDCQKELKLRHESLLKKENQINKLNVNLKQSENFINDYSAKIKVIKAAEKDLEEKNKVLIKANEKLKNENDDLCKQIKDLNLKILNLEENLIKENDLNENLKSELSEIKEKCENELVQVLNVENIQDCENQPHYKTADDVSYEALNSRSVDCMKNEAEKLENSSNKDLDEPNLCFVKSINQAKDALNHNFKSYQHSCIPQLKNSDTRLFEIGSSNIKLLPPLKTPFKESSTFVISDFGEKEYFSSATEPNLCFVKSINKAKDALNHNFKSYQHSCIPQLKNSDTRLFEIGSSNIKLLPPIKTPFKESSTFVISDFGEKEYFSSATEPNLCFVKSINKAKDALNHNFKSYQHSCIPQLKNSDTRLFEIGSSNIKLLPPIKTPFKKSSTFVISDFGKKEYFSSATDINFTDDIEYSQFDVSTKYVQRKFSVADNEIDKLENKTSIESNSKIKEKRGFLDSLLRVDIKDCQNHNFKKDIQCIKKTGMNDLEMTQKSSFQSKDVTETKKCGSSNKPLKICDNLLCENLNERVQNILQSDNVPDGNFKKENIAESSESVSKYRENSMNAKGFECKPNRDKYKIDSSKHMRTFLKHSLNTKTITSCHLDETSGTKFSGTRFELPWLDKW